MATGKIGHYTIVSELGRGGMGVVYKAHEESLNRFVAIKVLGEQLSGDPSFVARFVREAQAAAALSHPNIIQIFFIGEDNGRHYFVMEYVKGKSLLAIVKEEGRIENPRATQFMLQAANGLAAAHDRGFLHRDIKPANLLVDESGRLKIADFGLVLPQEAATRLTATGMLVGTPGYLSPEQCMAQPMDTRTDIYSLGVTFYEILSGRMPFQADSPLALLGKILHEEPPDIATLNDRVDEKTRAIVNRMIAKDRDKRYQSCHELIADLEASLDAMGARVAPSGLAGANAPRDPTLPSAFELVGETERMPSGAPPPALAPAGSVFAEAPGPAPMPAPVAVSASPVPASALVAAPPALPVAAPPARRSKAPFVVLAVAAVFLVALAGATFLALRSPLVKRFLPWGRSAAVRQVAKVAPVSAAPSAGNARETSQSRQPQPAAGVPAAAGSAATSPDAVEPSRPRAVAQRGNAPRDSHAGQLAASTAGARAEERPAALALAGRCGRRLRGAVAGRDGRERGANGARKGRAATSRCSHASRDRAPGPRPGRA